jgi:cytochrome c oxidase subunit 4
MQKDINETLPGRPEGADFVKQEAFPGGAQTANYDTNHEDDHRHIVPLTTYYKIFAALMVLLLITVGAAEFDFSERVGPAFAWMNIVVALAVAVTKAYFIVAYFMHVKYSSRLIALFAVAAYLFVGIMFLETYADYFTRHLINVPGR